MVALTGERAAGAARPAAPLPASLPPQTSAPPTCAARHAGAGHSRRRRHHRCCVGQGRRRQIDDGRQSRARACAISASRSACSMPIFMDRRCRNCSAIKGKPETLGGTRLKPMDGYGLKVMSIGFLIEEETPMIWRGPMVMSALTQMLREVEWGTLDVMVVDMPPGHRRRAAHDGAAGAAARRGDRLDAAGSRLDRCAARHRHVQARQRAGARRSSRT